MTRVEDDWEYDPDDHPAPEPYTPDAWATVEGAEVAIDFKTFPGDQPDHIPGQLTLEDV